jgi:hypothetical protein
MPNSVKPQATDATNRRRLTAAFWESQSESSAASSSTGSLAMLLAMWRGSSSLGTFNRD